MSQLTSKTRNALPKSDFGLPGQRKFPMPDAEHAAVAKGRAKQQENRGALSAGAYKSIVSKANRKLGK
jgi:hypothetical protein